MYLCIMYVFLMFLYILQSGGGYGAYGGGHSSGRSSGAGYEPFFYLFSFTTVHVVFVPILGTSLVFRKILGPGTREKLN